MKQDIRCRVVRTWVGWEGKITMPNGEVFRSGLMRETKAEAQRDAERMKEELEHGVDRR